ncbi:hypothetical protein [Gimesia aquarii]|nr:hypothetical protein [Gimesia aquarii]
MMFHFKTIICALVCLFTITCFSVSEGNQKGFFESEMAILRSIQTKQGPMIEITIGDLICTTPHLTIKRKQKPVSTVIPVKGKIEIKQGKASYSAAMFEIALRE